jgi:hypothetical protein
MNRATKSTKPPKPVLSAAAVKLSKAKIRAIVFDKCGGKCAYCGVDLVKGWNVDHIKPRIFGGTNDLDNLNPSCKYCNNYKCHTDLEGYRNQLHKMLNDKLEYLFKSKTKMQVAMNMGSIKHTLWDGKFHFERVAKSDCDHPITYATYTKFCPRKCLECGKLLTNKT